MTASFTTFFGDYLHGLFVTWESEPNSSNGTSELQVTFQMNLRAKLHVYGYTGDATPSDGSGIYEQDEEATWVDADKELYNIFVEYSADDPLANTAVNTFPTDADQYQMYVAWQNPDESASVSYDGIRALTQVEITPPQDFATSSYADIIASPPTITQKFQTVDGADSATFYDIVPGNAYGTNQDTTNNVDYGNDSAGNAYDTTTDLCTESWLLSLTAIACVEVKGALKRDRNTGDTVGDIILNYDSTYQMHAVIGRTADTTDESLKFEAQAVDFTQFYDETGALASASFSGAVLGAILYSLAF